MMSAADALDPVLSDALDQALGELPGRSAEIAALLSGRGCAGVIGDSRSDPLGEFLTARVQDISERSIEVLVSDVDLSVIEGGTLVHLAAAPAAVQGFVRDFDRGAFPRLVVDERPMGRLLSMVG
jgi:hypothetical protein